MQLYTVGQIGNSNVNASMLNNVLRGEIPYKCKLQNAVCSRLLHISASTAFQLGIASTEHSLAFRVRTCKYGSRYVAIATQPVHQLQIRPIVHN